MLDPSKRPTLQDILSDPFMGDSIPKTMPRSTLACPPAKNFMDQHQKPSTQVSQPQLSNKPSTALFEKSSKKDIEKEFLKWANETPERKSKYGSAIDSINSAYTDNDVQVAYQYAREAIFSGAEIFTFASKSSTLYRALRDKDEEGIKSAVEEFRAALDEYFKDYDANTDQKIAASLLRMYTLNVNPKYLPM